MHDAKVSFLLVLVISLVACQVTVPVTLNETGHFELEAGIPVKKEGITTFDPPAVTIGTGNLEVDEQAIRFDAHANTTLPALKAIREIAYEAGLAPYLGQSCLDNCEANVSLINEMNVTCKHLCESQRIIVAGRLALAHEADVCEKGDFYGPFMISFNDAGVISSVEPDAIDFSQNTLDALNSGQLAFCIEVVASVTGSLKMEHLNFNVGL